MVTPTQQDKAKTNSSRNQLSQHTPLIALVLTLFTHFAQATQNKNVCDIAELKE